MSMKEFGKKEDIIDFDFQGWPVYKMNIRSILKSLGFECEDGKWNIEDKSEYQTTFVQASSQIELKSGSLILLGNQLYRFEK